MKLYHKLSKSSEENRGGAGCTPAPTPGTAGTRLAVRCSQKADRYLLRSWWAVLEGAVGQGRKQCGSSAFPALAQALASAPLPGVTALFPRRYCPVCPAVHTGCLSRSTQQPTPVLLPAKAHGQRSLVDSSPWGLKELDTT